MLTTWFLSILLLQLHSPKPSAAVSLGADVVGVGVWINAGGNTPSPPSSDSPPDPADLAGAYTALQAWKSSITEDPFGVLASWVGSNVCSYKGVFCSNPPEDVSSSSSGLVVAAIDLNRASLRGSLVRELSLLTHLSILHLNTNRFTGSVPDTFRDLQFLSELDLSNNLLSGPFPTPTLLIPNLIYLDLRFNKFSGEVPEELFEKGLDAIFLNNNGFDGQIPESLWSSPASVITLANNRFTGTIPASFGYMGSGIKEILFFNNRLTGCIPEGVGYLPDIEVLDMSFNSLTGQVPGTLSCLSEIEVLNFAHNHLSGTLPEFVCSLRSLLNLTISYNFFSGFSQECTKLVFRNAGFNFSGNCIPGRGMQRPQPECTGLPGGGGLSCLRIPSTRPMACSRPGFQYSLPTSLPSRP